MNGLLFCLAILTALVEGAAQHFWLPAYFKFGVPIFIARIPEGLDDASGHSRPFTCQSESGGKVLIRQRRYGISRDAWFHGVATPVDAAAGEPPTCTLFVDWNVPFIGAFLSSAFIGAGLVSAIVGAALATSLCAIFVNRHRQQILTESAKAVARMSADGV